MRTGGRPYLALFLAVGLAPRAAAAATYVVGPGRRYADLQAVAGLLAPGDRVEVDGGVTYPGGVVFRASGTAQAKITVVGRRAGPRRPVIGGGATTVEFRGDHYVFEGFELVGGTSRCLFHHGDDLTVRDAVIHDCPGHGVLGADDDSGSLTLSYVEIYRAGRGEGAHPIYMATDEVAHPRSVFRLEHCFVHDGTGGNLVKSRAERNEIYANWLEGAVYHELELIGPDASGPKRRREDSDVVGNVIKKTRPGYAIRVGGDGTGETNGRYRFVNNTIVLAAGTGAAFRLFNGIESLEAHNNAIARDGGGPVRVLVEQEVRWAAGRPVIAGTNNWLPQGSSAVPEQWTATLFGRDPGFVSASDLRLAEGSPLIGAGAPAPRAPAHFEFPAPLEGPADLPPPGALERIGAARQRLRGPVDIGALCSVATPPSSASAPPPSAPPLPAPAVTAPPAPARGGCGCRSIPSASRSPALALAVACAAITRARRRRPRARARAGGAGSPLV
jgi:hypothetical protein